MPQAVAAAASYVTNAVIGALGSAGVAVTGPTAAFIQAGVYATAYAGITVGVQVGLTALTAAQLPNPEVGKLSLRQSRPSRKIAMGRGSRFGGAYMHWETSASTFGIVIALHDGRLDEISAIYLNDDVVTLDGDGWVQEGPDGRYGGGDLVRIKTRLGEPTETHYSEMTEKFSATWPTTARGDGIASLMMLATHRSRESFPKHFPNGEPNPSIVGVPVCYDWRDEAQDRADESTWGPCGNPVVWLVHHEWFRCGRSWDRVIAPVLDALTDEADHCDEVIAKIGGTEPRYEFGGWYSAEVQPQARRAALLATFDGWLSTDAQGRLVVKAGRYVAPTVTITGDQILGYDWRAFSPDEERTNKLVVTYIDPARDYTETEADPWVDQDDIDATGVERTDTLQLQWVQSRSQARRLAKRKMSRLAAERRGQIVTNLSGLNAWGQRYLRIQNPELASMADVVVEVMGAEFDPATGTCSFDVILADEDIDDWDPATEEGNAVGGATRPPPEGLDTPVIDEITPIFDDYGVRLEIEATGPIRPDLTWLYRWRASGTTSWVEGATTDGDLGDPILLATSFVTADATLEVQVAYLTGAGVESDWSATETIDTTPPPPDIVSLNFPGGPFIVGVSQANQVSGLPDWSYSRNAAATALQVDGTPTLFAADVERITDRGLLIETASTNLLLRSQEFDNASWTKSVGGVASAPVVTANAATAPDGTTTADSVVFTLNGGTAVGDISTLDQTVTVASGQAHRGSIWLRSATPCTLLIRHVAGGGYGTLNVTSTWTRFDRGETSAGTSGTFSFGLRGSLGSSNSATVEVWGAQLEQRSAPSSYVPTTTAAVTRPVDAATVTLPAGSAGDAIEVEHSGGLASFTRSDLSDPLLLDLGGGSGGAWVGQYIERVTVSPA